MNSQERGRTYGTPGSDFGANAQGLFVQLPDKKTEGWMLAYGEDLSRESGLLGTFTVVTNREKGKSARERYYFYPDGNVELRHWEDNDPTHPVMRYVRDQISTYGEVYDPVKWLDTTEITQLGLTIEGSHYLPHSEPDSY